MITILDGRFFRFTTKVSNLFLLNILWIIFSTPILTMGAATSAVYYVTLKMVKNEEGYIIKDFWYAFRQNLKQGIMIEFVLLVGGVILLGDIWYFLQMGTIFGYILAGIFSIGLT
ncbi:YesL family protein, partial [Neobacillus niacini]|uniref:YesL family protein n=1 Tax=Neobacillus niacini TaxID=86668 RepID=UPI003000E298